MLAILTVLTLLLTTGSVFAEKGKSSTAVAKSLDEYIRAAKAAEPPLQTSEGSLYVDAGLNSYLISDLKARRTNDILTIRVLENTTASSAADTEANRSVAQTLSVPNFFGVETRSASIPLASLVSATSESAFKGDGTTSRQGSVTALISARVRDVLPNGDLVIEGIKELKVNNERQTLTLYGVVRTRDIAPNNIVLSSAIANMQVQLDGKGIVSDHMKPGWLYRALTKVWPF
jgi:flagellar L-ring protein precursor FlgH